MRPLAQSAASDFAAVDFVLTDMDDTLTHRGRLPARTFMALERLQNAGVKVVPVTAAPAGWCDQMVRMWPVDAVIGENGGLAMRRTGATVERTYWLDDASERLDAAARLAALRDRLLAADAHLRLADDQPFRLTSLAFARPATKKAARDLIALLRDAGASATVNSLWVLAWFGDYDKLSAARRLMRNAFGLDIDSARERVVYIGDSTNDAPMFAHFPCSVGVSTLIEHLDEIDVPPPWITEGPGGAGFVEVADAVIAARAMRAQNVS